MHCTYSMVMSIRACVFIHWPLIENARRLSNKYYRQCAKYTQTLHE